MIRRRLLLALAGALGLVGLLMIPSTGGAAPNNKPAAQSSSSSGNGPKGTRCDPQPSKGNGPPSGKGQKCASP